MAEIKLKAFLREEMDGNGVSRKRVCHKHIKVLAWQALERNARVSGKDIDMGLRFAQKIELRTRRLNNERIDFEKCKAIPRLSVSCQGPGAQSDDSHADAAAFVSLTQGNGGARLRSIVRRGFVPASRFEDFDAVHDRSIDQISACRLICRSHNVLHSDDAIKI